MLHSRVLRYLGEVARSGSIRAAGEWLNVASSSINKHVLQAVLDGKADLGFAYNLPPTPNIEVMSRMNAQLGTVVSTAHPIAHMNMVPLSECLTYPLIFADKSMSIRQIVAEAFDASGQDANPAFETNSIEAMKSIPQAAAGSPFSAGSTSSRNAARAS